ncbi:MULTISPECIES: hypothetical protein [unclassified Romboutsia]|uniref:hypothetical protein n=1 Tax=unclassified Romboutsia TaxID=2626894 RepID=UPI000820B7EA|nr:MULTISPECIES: hypothetical protein [unclassified Romboutsia]SCI26248.1 Uncharacterised protein [uncultured Clostridium sp.]
MRFGDRILYDDGETYKEIGVFIQDINSKEAIVKFDNSKEKSIVQKKYVTFIRDMKEMDLVQAITVADYISKEKYDGHYTLLAFTSECRFCFGTLDKISYNTTSLMAKGKTIEEAIANAIKNNIDSDSISNKEDRMYK